MPTNLSLTHKLLIDIEQSSIGANDLLRAGQHVVDWIACASLGAHSIAGESYRALLQLDAVDRIDLANPCTLIDGKIGNWQDVIQHNGALGNVLEMDDIHRSSILHPGPVVIPAALAIAERFNCDSREFLSAVIKGYEVTIRIGEMIGRSHYQYFHNTATCGAFGAAMAASSLLKLDRQQTLWALGNAGSKTGGLWQMRNENVSTKQWHNAESARSGAVAAVLASKGLTGPEFILEGPQGVFKAMSLDACFDDNTHSQASAWRMYDCSFKPWPACRHAHPAMDALLSILAKNNVDITNIQQIRVGVYDDAKLFCDNVDPITDLQAKFSIQHALAAILRWGEPELAHYNESVFNDEAIKSLRKRIKIEKSASIEAKYPLHFGAQCQIDMDNGQQFSVVLEDTLGDPERPLSKAQLNAKAKMLLARSGWASPSIDALCEYDWAATQPISALTKLLKISPGGNQ